MIKKLQGIGLCALAWSFAVNCSVDDRPVQLLNPNTPGTTGMGGDGTGDSAGSARLLVEPSSVDLGWVTVGFPARARVHISNGGTSALAPPVIGWSSDGAGDFSLIQNECLTELKPGGSCTARVQLIPTRTGQLSAALRVQAAGGGTTDVPMSGMGLNAGLLLIGPAAGSFEDFGSVRIGSRVQSVFSVTNPGTEPSDALAFQVNRAEFSVLPPSGMARECVQGTTLLASGESCDVLVAFTPTGRGPIETTLTGKADGPAGSASLTLSGRGLAPGSLGASLGALNFDGVVLGDGAVRGVSFENQGDEPITLAGTNLAPVGAEGFTIQDSDCAPGRILAGGDSCSVLLEFRPPSVAQELTAELVVDTTTEQRSSIPLRGVGLDGGALLIASATPGGEAFGQVLVDAEAQATFQVTNPTAQPSGVLELTVSEGFELLTPPAAGDCVSGSTSLANGQACTLGVRFNPTRRGVQRGSLTVRSALAGAKNLALSGQGILAATLDVESEINFGRVFTSASTSRNLIVRNGGDEPLAPPRVEVTGLSSELASAFAFDSACSQPLAPGASCEIAVRLTPTQAVPHTATLELESQPGGFASVLLLAEALDPGSLALAAADGSSADFGDVAIGASSSRAFTLTNPASVPSGPLTIRADNSHFQVADGDCNLTGSAGLADGASCTFSVQFVPDASGALVANLSVQSPGAGRTGLELRGRGRLPAALFATADRSVGRANIGEAELTQPENEFVWIVTNTGDLSSGALSLTNENQAEFELSDDGCSNAQIPGGGQCQMTIRFRPADIGTRTGRLVLSDAAGMRSVALTLTGLGVRLAQLGESCVNATCADGVCSRGVCCDRECGSTCQVCSQQGVCTDQANREPCGNANARCFGVNACLLPEAQPCGLAADCGSNNCERRLGGQGPADNICCLSDCDGTGQQCNAEGQCQQPTLARDALCGRAGDLGCGDGLACKACLDGVSRCTPPNVCCGGCDTGYQCNNGTCGCAAPAGGGLAPIDCGNGQCIPNRANACCPETPACGAARPNCDPTDFLCKECLTANECPGTNRTCQAGACSCAANQQFVNNECRLNQGQPCTVNGAVTCAAGSCEQSNAGGTRCCNRDCGQNELCNNQNQCQCQGCTINGSCVAQGTPNQNNRCEVCDTARNPNAFSPSTAADCRKADGADCTGPAECAGGQCVLFYGDDDGDGFAPQSALATAGMFCTRANGTLPQLTRQRPTSRATTDCLDSNADVRPTQTAFFVNGVVGLTPRFDYNCDGLETDGFNNRLSNCNDTGLACVDRGGWGGTLPQCGSQETGIGGVSPCGLNDLNNCVPFPGGPGNRSCH